MSRSLPLRFALSLPVFGAVWLPLWLAYAFATRKTHDVGQRWEIVRMGMHGSVIIAVTGLVTWFIAVRRPGITQADKRLAMALNIGGLVIIFVMLLALTANIKMLLPNR